MAAREKNIKKEQRKNTGKLLEELEALKKENADLKAFIWNGRKKDSDQKVYGAGFLSSNYHRAFFHQIPFLMWSKDTEGRYITVNASFLDKLGLKNDDVVGKTDADIFPEKFAGHYRETDELVFKELTQHTFESVIPFKNIQCWFEIIKVPFADNDGKLAGVAGFARDISERKEYESALKASEEKFRKLAESVSDSYLIMEDDRVIYVNPAFESTYGYSQEELFSNPHQFIDCIHPEDKERIQKTLFSEEFRKNRLLDEQYRVIKKNGEVCWVWNRIYPLPEEKGNPVSRLVSVASNITEIKKLEEDLRKSRFEQQAILDNIPHLAWLKNDKFRYVSANQAFCEFFNLKPEEIVGLTDYDLVSKEMADDYIAKDREVLATAKQALFFEVERSKFGSKYSETYKTPVIAEDGTVIGIAGISRDITQQRIAERALQKSEEKFKDLVTLLPEVVFETDVDVKITFMNMKGFELSGYTLADLVKGIDLISIISPDDRERARDVIDEVKKGRELRGLEFNLLTKGGEEVPVLVFTNNMYHEAKWIGVRGVLVDNSNRKKAEEQERIYQSKLVYLSDTALDFLSMAQEENLFDFIGQRLRELLHDTEIILSSFNEKTSTLNIVFTSFDLGILQSMRNSIRVLPEKFEFQLDQADILKMEGQGEQLMEFEEGLSAMTLGKTPLEASNLLSELLGIKRYYGMALTRAGKIYGSILLLTRKDRLPEKHFIEAFIYQASIALHRRQLEQELIEAKTLAEESDRLKTAFLANMSHEIRTPMNGILGLTQLMTSQPIPEDQRKEYLAMINANGKMLLDLVNDIIDISKIESRQVDLFETEFSLNQMMNELHCFISAEKMVKKMEEVELIYDPYFNEDQAMIFSDQAKIKQVLINLIGNAVKFTNKGSIEFGYKLKDKKELLFYVKDTGIGIHEDKLDVIFDRFTQADQSLTRPYGGSGLGLAISKGFVERMGGKIWAESEENSGSTFYFTIPYKPVTRDKAGTVAGQVNIDFDWSDLTILVVEDNIISYKLLEISLSKTGCKVLHADNGQNAIDMVEAHPDIDLVLMDIQLPVINGYDATRAIKEIKPELPVIAQTANAMDDDRQKCIEAGCSDYITKPIVLDKLLPVIETYLS